MIVANALLFTLLALVLAYALAELFHYFRLPRVIGQLLAGIVLGIPFLKGVLYSSDIDAVAAYPHLVYALAFLAPYAHYRFVLRKRHYLG